MGSNFSTLTVHCCVGRDRDHERHNDPVNSIDLSEIESKGSALAEPHGQKEQPIVTECSEDAPTTQTNAVKSSSVDPELQQKIQAIVDSRIKNRNQSSVPDNADSNSMRAERQPTVPCSSREELQDQINVIVGAHAKSLKQQRLAMQDDTPLPSPSPAKSLTNAELAHFAKLALSGAKDRKTPAMSPATPQVGWAGGEFVPRPKDFVPRHLNFADCDDTRATQKVSETRAFALKEIPTPSRDRAIKMPRADEPEQACKEESANKVVEDDEKIRLKIEEAMEMAEMDNQCVFAFLECVKACAKEDRVRTPIKGTNLYTKHMRPCRPLGSSVDVKDSSFKSLRNFLLFLESEGLLRLQPGVSDPVVAEIKFGACRKYKYAPRIPRSAKSD